MAGLCKAAASVLQAGKAFAWDVDHKGLCWSARHGLHALEALNLGTVLDWQWSACQGPCTSPDIGTWDTLVVQGHIDVWACLVSEEEAWMWVFLGPA
jgi:hypothetical protein